MFAQDLEAIDQLRSDAVTILEPHNSGIKKIAGYAAQLVWLGGKFPIDVSYELMLFCISFETSLTNHDSRSA